MTKTILAGLLSLVIYGCATQPEPGTQKKADRRPQFSNFEISYRGGWSGGFCFRVDSNRIYFCPATYPNGIDDIVKYGLLPDSIFQHISSIYLQMQTDSSIQSGYNYCDDCPVAAIQAIMQQDTIRLFQVGEISTPLWKLINQLQLFIDSAAHNQVRALMIPETAARMAKPPPPIGAGH